MMHEYSGQFDPDMGFEKLSQDALIKLLKLYSKLYLAVDGFWYLAVKERFGNEEALFCDDRVWERGVKYELDKLTTLFDIRGSDVSALMKTFQLHPWISAMEHEIVVKNDGDATLTIISCPTIASMEREGEGRDKTFCTQAPLCFNGYAAYINPAIEVTPIKLPPRKSRDEICCQWNFSLK